MLLTSSPTSCLAGRHPGRQRHSISCTPDSNGAPLPGTVTLLRLEFCKQNNIHNMTLKPDPQVVRFTSTLCAVLLVW